MSIFSNHSDKEIGKREGLLQFELSAVSVNYGSTQALSAVNIQIQKGELIALVGPSGAGKTTLLNILGTGILPTQGQAIAFASDISKASANELKDIRSTIGFVHQQHYLLPNVRVIHNILLGRLSQLGLITGMIRMIYPGSSITSEAYEILKSVGIPNKLYERTDTLSGGEQQRVAIARALFQNPEVILADEPVSSVDPARAREVIRLFINLAKERGTTLVTSLHNIELAREFFPRLIGLRSGKIAFDTSSRTLTEKDFSALYQIN